LPDNMESRAHDRILASATGGDDISAFLDIWLRTDLLTGEEAVAFDHYYASYKRNFGPYIRHHYRNQTRELQQYLDRQSPLRVLEVGCGCGTESLWMSLRGHSVKAIDVSEKLLRVAETRKRLLENATGREVDCDFELKSLLDLDESGYDLVWLEQAFHHLEPRETVVVKISRLLRPGGHLVISESNAWNPLLQLMLYRLRGGKTIINYHGVTWGNERVLTPGSLSRVFLPHGINPVSVRYFRMLPNRGWAERLTALTGIFDEVDHWWLRPLYTHYNYVGCKQY
jgi:2-polyprenyl-3-methyl-5-hydroxy-6-metoxy-1,4-benzoquinol methylase